MSLSALAAGIMAGGSLLQSVLQSHANKNAVDDMNRYNSPAEQVKRLKAGSLNPARMFGSMNVDAGLQSQPQETVDYSAIGNSSAALASTLADTKLKESQKENVDADTNLKNTQAALTGVQTDTARVNLEYLPRILDTDLSLKDVEKELKEVTKGMTEEQTNVFKETVLKTRREVSYLDHEIDFMVENVKKAKSEAVIADLRAKATPEFIQQEMNKNLADIKVSKETAAQLSALVQSINKDTDIKELQRQAQDVITQGVKMYGMKNAANESIIKSEEAHQARTNTYRNVVQGQMEVNQANRQAYGQTAAEIMAPVGEVAGAFGRVLGGFVK